MTNIELSRDCYRISTDPPLLDMHVGHACLMRSYWTQGISRDIREHRPTVPVETIAADDA